jgi:phosphohistidine swiveling domain-containing protein
MSGDYSKMSVEELEREIEGILKRQHRKDDLFRLAVLTGQMDLAKFIYHDRTHLPEARHGKNPSKAGETVAYGQALVQLLLLAKSRGLELPKVFEYAVEHMKDDEYKERKPRNGGEIRGHPVTGGRVIGKAYVVSEGNPLENAPEGSIIVVEHANPGIAETVSNALAVVTDQGGRLSHLAIVARERGMPAVIGTGNATELIRTGDLVAVDATRGIVTISEK